MRSLFGRCGLTGRSTRTPSGGPSLRSSPFRRSPVNSDVRRLLSYHVANILFECVWKIEDRPRFPHFLLPPDIRKNSFFTARIPTYDPPVPRILFSGVAHGPALRHRCRAGPQDLTTLRLCRISTALFGRRPNIPSRGCPKGGASCAPFMPDIGVRT